MKYLQFKKIDINPLLKLNSIFCLLIRGKMTAPNIDESLYSRQMYVYGKSMQDICTATVLLWNLSGLGVEVAKNLILSGIKELDIVDTKSTIENNDSGNIYITKDDIGKNLIDVVVPKLRELNPYVTVNVIDDDKIEYSKYKAVIVLDASLDAQVFVNNQTHKANVPFVSAVTYGLTGCVFNDFGTKFTVNDPTGENIQEATISQAYTKTEEGKTSWFITSHDSHDLSSGSVITLYNTRTDESQGPFKVKELTRSADGMTHIFELDTETETTFNPELFNSYGELKEVRQPVTIDFKPLSQSLTEPSHSYIFYEQMSRQDMLHVIYQLQNAYENLHGRAPKPYDETDFNDFMKCLEQVKTEVELDEDFVKKFINHGGLVPAMISVIGSLASQEVLKAVTGKYTPINQFMYFESFESLPDEGHVLSLSKDVTSRYGHMVNVFGLDFMTKLLNLKMFMVGCGAIGCELLKNFAMMGIACGPEGSLTVTDPDTIEKSNLNRQFLFRTRHIGQFKSEAAVEAVMQMNPDMKLKPLRDKVGPESEGYFSTQFYNDLDIVANALDNIKARTYVDGKCVENKKPLLESGTLGVKGNVQVVVPNKSESYASSSDPPEKDIPVCTLKNFPSQIEHTSQWALSVFKSIFEDAPNNINRYLEKPEYVADLSYDELDNVYRDITRHGKDDVPKSSHDSIVVAIKYFNYYFNDMIKELLKQFPADHVTSTGTPFWSGSKRCPKPIEFDSTNPEHVNFVNHFVHLYDKMYGFDTQFAIDSEVVSTKTILQTAHTVPLIPYPVNEKFAANDEEEKEMQEKKKNSTDEVGDMIRKLNPADMKLKVSKLFSDKFEKDDDSNHHIDFISTVANLRATNYEIPTADRHKIKGIVGRIIPAVATTTSLVAGLVSLELCKLVAGHTDLTKFRNAFINLGLSFMAFSDPTAASVQKLGDREFTMWDHLDIKGDMPLKEFRAKIEEFYGVEVDSINCGQKSVYNSCIVSHLTDERNNMMMSDLLKMLEVDVIKGNCLTMNIMLDTEEEDFEEPDVRYYL